MQADPVDVVVTLAPLAVWAVVAAQALARPGRAWWPPRRGNLPTAAWAWGVTTLIYVGLWDVGVAGWPGDLLPRPLAWIFGGALTLTGAVLHWKATADLGLAGTSGWDRGVVRAGLYARMRHPQYLGQAMSLLGWGLLTAEALTLALAALAAGALALVGAAEERVLAHRHGPEWEAYRAASPFWGWRRG